MILNLNLNILDQSPVINGTTPGESVNQTIELAILADKLGYKRFWVSEHHNTKSFASASPEILIPAIASKTKSIRVGSGGVLISHYSPLKIAEQFNLIGSLYKGRIDLGIGRAPGGSQKIINALNSSSDDAFKKIDLLTEYLVNSSGSKSPNHVTAVPEGQELPEIWILGTSPDSAVYAAKKGLPYAFGSFINDEFMIQCFSAYYNNFVPSSFLKEPYLNLALFVICGDSEEEAQRMAKCSEYWLVENFLHGKNIPFPDEETSLNHNFTMEEKLIIEYRRKSALIGKASEVSDKIKLLAKKYAVHEFTIVTITSSFEKRKKSYQLLAENLIG